MKDVPTNIRAIEDLRELHGKYWKTMGDEDFLPDDSYGDQEYNLTCERMFVFATRKNLRLSFNCDIWFVDGTFKMTLIHIFQLFAIRGTVKQSNSLIFLSDSHRWSWRISNSPYPN